MIKYLTQHTDYKLELISLNVIAHQLYLIDYLPPEFCSLGHYSKEFEQMGVLAKIVHYASIEKPWYRYTNTPLRESWLKMCSETPLADIYPTSEGFRSYLSKNIERFIYYHISRYKPVMGLILKLRGN